MISSQPMSFEPMKEYVVPSRPKRIKVEHLLSANLITMGELLKKLERRYMELTEDMKMVKAGIGLLESQNDDLKDTLKEQSKELDELVGKKRGRLQKDSERRKRKKEEREKNLETRRHEFHTD